MQLISTFRLEFKQNLLRAFVLSCSGLQKQNMKTWNAGGKLQKGKKRRSEERRWCCCSFSPCTTHSSCRPGLLLPHGCVVSRSGYKVVGIITNKCGHVYWGCGLSVYTRNYNYSLVTAEERGARSWRWGPEFFILIVRQPAATASVQSEHWDYVWLSQATTPTCDDTAERAQY